MTIIEINKKNRNAMKGSIHNDLEMAWNDNTLMDVLLGHVPKLRPTKSDSKANREIHKLKEVLEKYQFSETNAEAFLNEVSDIISQIQEIAPHWYGLSIEEVSYFIAMQNFCVISGFGGMGKSFFIFRLEEQLENNLIPHLCVYGKFQKTIEDIDFSEIRRAAEKGTFLFVADAINEMDYSSQINLINEIKLLRDCKGLRVIMSYRTHKLSEDVLTSLNGLASYQYSFSGVSYESALEELMRKPVLNVYKYESVLYSNNAFYLQMLSRVLSKSVLEDEEINSFSTLTHILEAYIKDTLGKKHWRNTKTTTKWMYDNREREIPRTELCALIEQPDEYILLMKQYGLFNEREIQGEVYYSFLIETLTDYMLARYFVQEIQGKRESEQLAIIQQRRADFFGMDEAFIISLFDLSNDYHRIKRLLIRSGLNESFTFEVLSHIVFKQADAKSFQSAFPISNQANPLLTLGGYSNKPYNCINFLNEYYFNSPERQEKELSSLLSGQVIPGRLTERLKNMVYFVSVVNTDIAEEMLWFALWCTASPNQRTRCFALKLLYEITKKEPVYIDKIIAQWDRISDCYIKEAVIQVLSLVSDIEGHGIQEFLSGCMNDPLFHLARSIKRIEKAQGTPYRYIHFRKENLYEYQRRKKIPKRLNDLFWYLDILDKYLLPFRYWSEEHVDCIAEFLLAQKNEIESWNRTLEKMFCCVKNGECNGSSSFEKWVQMTYAPSFSLEVIDMRSFLISFGKCIETIMIRYGIDVFNQKGISELSFSNSLFRKVIDVSVDCYYGSIMCNYFTNNFASYNNTQNSIGFEVYDPLEYDEEEINLASPAPTYESAIETMGDIALSFIDRYDTYDEIWSKDAEQSIANIQHLFQPVRYKKNEWIMLNAKIRLSGNKRVETYDIHCCTDPSIHLTGKYEDRFLTIELPKYLGSLDQYRMCAQKPDICKVVPSIKGNTDWFDATELMFPPAQIVKDLDLHYDLSNMSWITKAGDIVIRCDNNKKSYLQSEISSAIFMRKDFYDFYTAGKPIHFFCFTEKMLDGKGYTSEASLHLEFSAGKLVNKFYNAEEQSLRRDRSDPVCHTCPYGFVESVTEKNIDKDEVNKLMEQFGYRYSSDNE